MAKTSGFFVPQKDDKSSVTIEFAHGVMAAVNNILTKVQLMNMRSPSEANQKAEEKLTGCYNTLTQIIDGPKKSSEQKVDAEESYEQKFGPK